MLTFKNRYDLLCKHLQNTTTVLEKWGVDKNNNPVDAYGIDIGNGTRITKITQKNGIYSLFVCSKGAIETVCTWERLLALNDKYPGNEINKIHHSPDTNSSYYVSGHSPYFKILIKFIRRYQYSIAVDVSIAPQAAPRQPVTIDRFIRDTAMVVEIKKLVGHNCQLCELNFPLPRNKFYIEGHHIKPLSKNGPDDPDNILIVCPNCHVKCDYKLIELNLMNIKNNKQNINQKYIDFHNREFRANAEN